jgi:hypothetical protein
MKTNSAGAAPRPALLAFVALAPFAVGCASRAVPFDALDKAQITIYKIQTPQPVAAPGLPGMLPGAAAGANPLAPLLQQLGIPAEMQQQAGDLLKQWQQMGIPGLPPIPGLTPAPTATTPAAPPLPMLRNQWQIVDQRPVMDEATRTMLLDLFGTSDNFNTQQARCWTPGLAVSFVDPSKPEPVDVVISLSCGAANGFGFPWPHPNSYSLQPQAGQQLQQLYQSLFGPVPPQGV